LHQRMKRSTVFSSLLLICFWDYVESSCPENVDISPCECFQSTRIISCNGNGVDILPFKKLKGDFQTLLITKTKLKTIAGGVFGEAKFKEIIITENNELTSINSDAFIGSNPITTTDLIISKNKVLKDTDIFALALKFRTNLVWIEFNENKLTAIKKGTFNDYPKLETLRLDRNLIELNGEGITIDEGAFGNLTNLQQLNMNGTKISQINRNAIDLSSTKIKDRLIVKLNDTGIAIEEDKEIIKFPSMIPVNASVFLDLKHNTPIRSLKQINGWISKIALSGAVVLLTLEEKPICICTEVKKVKDAVNKDKITLVGVFIYQECKLNSTDATLINLKDC